LQTRSLRNEKEGFVRAPTTWARERAKLRACRPLLARRPAGYYPELVLNRTVHPVCVCTPTIAACFRVNRSNGDSAVDNARGLLDGSAGHTEIVQRGCVSRGWFNTGMGNGDSYQPYTLCPARWPSLGDVSPILFPSCFLIVISLNLNLSLSSKNVSSFIIRTS